MEAKNNSVPEAPEQKIEKQILVEIRWLKRLNGALLFGVAIQIAIIIYFIFFI